MSASPAAPPPTRTWRVALHFAVELLPALLLVAAYLTTRERETRAKPWMFLATGGRTEFVRWLPDSGSVELASGSYQMQYRAVDLTNGRPTADSYSTQDTSRLSNVRQFRWNAASHALTPAGQAKFLTSVRAYSANGTLAVTYAGGLQIHLRDAATGTLRRTFTASAPVTSLALSPDGALLAEGNEQRAELWDTRTGVLRCTLRTDESAEAVHFSPDGTLVGVSTSQQVRIWDAATGQPRGHADFPQSDGIASFDFAPDNQTLAMSSFQNSFALFNLHTRQRQGLSALGGEIVLSTAFSPDGQELATAGHGKVQLWDSRTLTLRRTLRSETATFIFVTFSPDGRSLLAQTNFGKIALWKLR